MIIERTVSLGSSTELLFSDNKFDKLAYIYIYSTMVLFLNEIFGTLQVFLDHKKDNV